MRRRRKVRRRRGTRWMKRRKRTVQLGSTPNSKDRKLR